MKVSIAEAVAQIKRHVAEALSAEAIEQVLGSLGGHRSEVHPLRVGNPP